MVKTAIRGAKKEVDHVLPRIVAHRGDSGYAPENTLIAFERAWQLDVAYVEFDYHHTSDDVPVVMHDDTVDRTTNARALGYPPDTSISSLKVEDFMALNAARWPSGRWFAFRCSHPPTVAEVLRRAVSLDGKCVIERQTPMVRLETERL